MRLSRTKWILLSTAILVALLVAVFDWNWLRGPISSYLGGKLGREVVIHGDLRGEFSLKPLLTADNMTISNAPWGSQPLMTHSQQVAARIDLLTLFRGPVALLELTLVKPELLLERDAQGRGNWVFGDPVKNPPPELGRLAIDSGVLRFFDPTSATDITVNVTTSAATAAGELPTQFSGAGKVRNNPFTIKGTAATVLALEKANQPYRMDVEIKSGPTTFKFDGTVVPARSDNVDGALALQGRDLSELDTIIPAHFPWTPPYRLQGKLKHGSGTWSFHDFSGKIGDSDLAGRFDIDVRNQRHRIDADLVSGNLNYRDLGGLVGLPPATASAPAMTAAQKAEAAKRQRSGRTLPARPYKLEGLRAVDARVRLQAKRFKATEMPLDNLDVVMDLKNGVLKLQPFDFGVGGGRVALRLTMDATDKVIRTSAEATARNIELKRILPALKPPNGSAGKVGGQAHMVATGNSIADMLASSNGELALIGRSGDASALAIVLTNLDLARAAQLLLRGDKNAPIHCVVADFASVKGVMTARTLVIDTSAEKIIGDGKLDFANERYDLKLTAQSKRPSLIALRGPILIDGSFSHPNVHPAAGPLATRVGASAALGLMNPLAALLPLIDRGGAKDADCDGLIEQANDNVNSRETPNKP